LFAERTYSVLTGFAELNLAGELPEAVARGGGAFFLSLGVYNVLSYVRVLSIGIVTLYGVSILAKEKNHYRSFLFGFILAPLLLFSVGWFIDRTFDVRHLLFLLIPTFIVAARAMQKLDKKILALCLLIILVPAPFQLFAHPGDPTPTYIYDKSKTQPLLFGRGVFYRENNVLAAASRLSSYTEGNFTGDSYTSGGLLFYYDPYNLRQPRYLLQFLSDPELISKHSDIILVHGPYLNSKFIGGLTQGLYEKFNITMPVEEFKDYNNRLNSVTNRVYDNGDVVGWKNP